MGADPLTAAVVGSTISGGASLLGGSMTNSAAQANQAATEQFDEQMSNTQYTRGVQDMRNAGLNPILAVGSPDSAPVVGTAPVVNSLGDAASAATNTFNGYWWLFY